MFKQKFQIGQRVFHLGHKREGAGFSRDKYEIRDAVVIGIRIQTDFQLKSNKTFNGTDFAGPQATIVLMPNSYKSSERYDIGDGILHLANELDATLEEARARYQRMVERCKKDEPGTMFDPAPAETIENYTVLTKDETGN